MAFTLFLILFAVVFLIGALTKRKLKGDAHLLKGAFEGPPGALTYVIHHPSGLGGGSDYEHFIASVAAKGVPDFSVDIALFTKLSRRILDDYSNAQVDKVFKNYTTRRKLPASWGRKEKVALILAMSAIPVQIGRIESRTGRLVLHWHRMVAPPSEFFPASEELLPKTTAALEVLAAMLSDLENERQARMSRAAP